MLSLNRYRLQTSGQEGHRGAAVPANCWRTPTACWAPFWSATTVNILASSIATVLAMQLWGEAGIAIATIGLTIILLIFGEITPKTLAAREIIAYPSACH